MIPTGLAILIAVGTFFMGYNIGSIVEHHRSQEEIDDLSARIHAYSEEQLKEENWKNGS